MSMTYTEFMDSSKADDIHPYESFTLYFYGPFDPTSLPTPTENGTPKLGTWTTSGNAATFIPTALWQWGSTVHVDYSVVRDTLGRPLINPDILTYNVLYSDEDTNIALVDTVLPYGGYLSGTNALRLVFSQPVDLATLALPVDSGGNPVAGSWAYADHTGFIVEFVPAATWPANDAFSLNFAGLKDQDGSVSANNDANTLSASGSVIVVHSTPIGPTPFRYLSYTTDDADLNIEGMESVTLTFSEPVNPKTLPPFKDADGRHVVGNWEINGVFATFAPLVPWSNYNAPIDFDTSVVLSIEGDVNTNGILITNPSIAPVVIPPITYIGFVTGEGDSNLADRETLTLNFDSPVAIATLTNPISSSGTVIAGAWTTAGNSATFTPVANWQTYAGPISFMTNGIGSAAGGLISNPVTIQVMLEPAPAPVGTFNYTGMTTAEGDGMVRGFEGVTVNFDSATNPITMMNIVRDATSALVAGTWTPVAGGVTFVPDTAWETYTGPFSIDLNGMALIGGETIFNPQIVTLPLEPYVPPLPFLVVSTSVQSGATHIAGTRERVAITFNRAPNHVSIFGGIVVTRTDTGAVVPGDWAVSGSDALFRPTNNWDTLNNSAAKFRFTIDGTVVSDADSGLSLSGLDANNNVVQELQFPYFAYTNAVTSQGDNRLWDLEKLILNFDSAPTLASLPVVNSGTGIPIAGNWTVVGNAAEFVPNGAWQAFSGSVTADTAAVVGLNGAMNSMRTVVSMPIGTDLVKTGHQPVVTQRISGFGSLIVSYNLNNISITTDATVTENGVAKAGTWSNGSISDRVFTPATEWGRNATVVVDWSNAAAGASVMSNPGSNTYQARDWFELVSSTPANNGLLGSTQPLVLTYDKPILVAQGLPTPAVQATNAPVAGSWSASGNSITFTPTNPWPVNTDMYIRVDVVTPTDGTPFVSGPQSLTFRAAAPLTFNWALPAPGTSFTGTSQLLFNFSSEPLQSSLPTPLVVFNSSGFPNFMTGTWDVTSNQARFTPSGAWPAGTLTFNTAGIQNLAGEATTNPTSMQWTVT
jgi:hypothetical protein